MNMTASAAILLANLDHTGTTDEDADLVLPGLIVITMEQHTAVTVRRIRLLLIPAARCANPAQVHHTQTTASPASSSATSRHLSLCQLQLQSRHVALQWRLQHTQLCHLWSHLWSHLCSLRTTPHGGAVMSGAHPKKSKCKSKVSEVSQECEPDQIVIHNDFNSTLSPNSHRLDKWTI